MCQRMLVLLAVAYGVVTVPQEWEQALAHFGFRRPARVAPINFYRSLAAVDFVSPQTVVTVNPLQMPQVPLIEGGVQPLARL